MEFCSSSDRNPGWFDYVGDCTTQLYGEYVQLLYGPTINQPDNQYNEMSQQFCVGGVCQLTDHFLKIQKPNSCL